MKNEVLIEAARVAMVRFEEFKCERTWAEMVSAVVKCSGMSRVKVSARLERKYGRQFAREVL